MDVKNKLTTNGMQELFEEATIESKDAAMVALFKIILPYIVLFSLIVVIYMWISSYRIKKQEETQDLLTSKLYHAIELIKSGKKAEAEEKLREVANSDSKISVLATIALSNFDSSNVLHSLEKVIENNEAFPIMRNYAKLVWLSMVLDGASGIKTDKITTYCAISGNEPLFGNISISKALWYIKSGQPKYAEEILKQILVSKNIPEIVKMQATAIMSNLIYDDRILRK